MPRRRLLSLLAPIALLGALAACNEDPPTVEGAVETLTELCTPQASELEKIDVPRTIFELEESAYAAFRIVSPTLGAFNAEGLEAMSDEEVQAYLTAAVDANNAISELSNAAGFEDADRIYATVGDAGKIMERVDRAADGLGLDEACGRDAWGAALFEQATDVVVKEAQEMAPTGDYRADLATYCGRYRKAVADAPKPEDLNTNRAYAFTLLNATDLLRERVRPLTPPQEDSAAHRALLRALADQHTVLVPAESLAIDGQEPQLKTLVDKARGNVTGIDGQLTDLGCDG